MRSFGLVLVTLVAATGAARATEVERSITIARPPAEVWALAGPFCAIARWHPAIVRCEPLTFDGKPYRRLTTRTEDAFLEREIERDEAGTSYRYATERSPLPVADHRSTFRVEPAGQGTRVVWRSDFTVPAGKDEKAVEATIAGIYEAGLQGLAARLAP
ncbi:SRPBCC family protein [Benzoatithermus flavus]|uniref:SRPBCC family protein n=1 Tax=Benzoatithermus flavus TaxID=3108223 RepID=A0ABU8XQ09_9PROT